jgi:hypothetical protein
LIALPIEVCQPAGCNRRYLRKRLRFGHLARLSVHFKN